MSGRPCCPALAEMLIEPVADPVPGVDLMVALRPAVAFARIHDELCLTAGFDEGVVELGRLRERRAQIVFSVQDQRRRLAFVRVVHGRPARIWTVWIVGVA